MDRTTLSDMSVQWQPALPKALVGSFITDVELRLNGLRREDEMKSSIPMIILLWSVGMIIGALLLNPATAGESSLYVNNGSYFTTQAMVREDPTVSPDNGLLAAVILPQPSAYPLGTNGQAVGVPRSETPAPVVDVTLYDSPLVTRVAGIFNNSASAEPDRIAIPEPGSILLLGTGLFGIAGLWRRRSRQH